jgi:peptidoglycan hydrolase-like protein with peptidoglycan-binding domain
LPRAGGNWISEPGGLLVLDVGEPDDEPAVEGEFLLDEILQETRTKLSRGSRGSAVRELQSALRGAGLDPGAIDGIFGRQTEAAVRAFQSARRLSVDGIVGPRTWSQLLAASPVVPPHDNSTGVWVLPPAVRAIGEAQFVNSDPAPAWAGDPGNCTGAFTAGAEELRQYIRANFGGVRDIGGYACRQNTANPAETSVHGVGRALDIMITPIEGRANSAVGDPIANWLVKNATAIGIQYLIWNRTQWSGKRSGRKDSRYGGPHPHNDHIHAELNRAGAERSTPWFLAGTRTT